MIVYKARMIPEGIGCLVQFSGGTQINDNGNAKLSYMVNIGRAEFGKVVGTENPVIADLHISLSRITPKIPKIETTLQREQPGASGRLGRFRVSSLDRFFSACARQNKQNR
jgi:hypothetical protein